MAQITVVGLGPGDFGLLTMAAWEAMQAASPLLLRTAVHPTAEALRQRGIAFTSYDARYEAAADFDSLYEFIAADLLARAEDAPYLVYAVPGSPLVAERTVGLLRQRAEAAGVKLVILPGMSFAEIFCHRLGVDPVDGLTIVDAGDIARLPADLPTGCIVTQVYSLAVASETKLSLMEHFPDEYEIVYAHHLGLPDESIRRLPLYELDRQPDIDHLTSFYLPPRPGESTCDFLPLTEIMKRLREPGGCPWDRAQTPASLRPHILEEAYEVAEAIDLEDSVLLCEELGDMLFHIVFQARLAEEAGLFSLSDVVKGITEKLIRRHPHIFGDVQATDVKTVAFNWEVIKRREKPERHSAIDGVPAGMAALLAAEKFQEKAARVGFDWENITPVWEKCREEYEEFKAAVEAGDASRMEEEFGDLLFSFVNLSRFLGLHAEVSLLAANRKFVRRFRYVEEQVGKNGGAWQNFTLEELDKFWKQAKFKESL